MYSIKRWCLISSAVLHTMSSLLEMLLLFIAFVQVVSHFGQLLTKKVAIQFYILFISTDLGPLDIVTNDNSLIAQQGEVLDLGQTANWEVSSSRANVSVPASVPGGIYSDLRKVNLVFLA